MRRSGERDAAAPARRRRRRRRAHGRPGPAARRARAAPAGVERVVRWTAAGVRGINDGARPARRSFMAAIPAPDTADGTGRGPSTSRSWRFAAVVALTL